MHISIITVCYNDVEALGRTINSVRKNKTEFMSFYVIDGNSTDGTFELLSVSSDVIDDLIVENDLGLYDAMNKCTRFKIQMESFLFFLNAGDELLPQILGANESSKDADVLYLSVVQKLHPLDRGKEVKSYLPDYLNEKSFMPKSVFRHQGFLVKMKIFNKYKYDLSVGQQADGLLMSLCQQNELKDAACEYGYHVTPKRGG